MTTIHSNTDRFFDRMVSALSKSLEINKRNRSMLNDGPDCGEWQNHNHVLRDGKRVSVSDARQYTFSKESEAVFTQTEDMYVELTQPTLQKLVVDAEQAVIFNEMENVVLSEWQEKLRLPFPHFFMEFSEPIRMHSPDPDTLYFSDYESLSQEDRMVLNAMANEDNIALRRSEDDVEYVCGLLVSQISNVHNMHWGEHYETATVEEKQDFINNYRDAEKYPMCWVTFFLSNENVLDRSRPVDVSPLTKSIYFDRSLFLYMMETGGVFAKPEILRRGSDSSDLPDDATLADMKYLTETLDGEVSNLWDIPIFYGTDKLPHMVELNSDLGITDRYKGWEERRMTQYGSLLSWFLLYLMSKGLNVVPEELPRAERRRVEKEFQKTGEHTKPWHVITVKPRFGNEQNGSDTGSTHGHRYDVMGHIRVGNHKLRDGSYRKTLEWVQPHQRGLQYSTYVPSTRKIESNKKTDPRMKGYFPSDDALPFSE